MSLNGRQVKRNRLLSSQKHGTENFMYAKNKKSLNYA